MLQTWLEGMTFHGWVKISRGILHQMQSSQHVLLSRTGCNQGATKALQKRGQIMLGVFPKCHKRENKIDFCLITNSGFF